MASDKHAAEKKFWRTPELVENALLPFLDLESVEQMAKAHDLTVEILGKTFTWNKLVKRTFPDWTDWTDVEEKSKARSLAGILLKIQSPHRDQLEHDLLHTICKRSPRSKDFVDLKCSCLETHRVSLGVFLLLEEVEARLGSVEPRIVKVATPYLLCEPFLGALASRIARQGTLEKLERFGKVFCSNKESADAWVAILLGTQEVVVNGVGIEIFIVEEVGAEGWAAIRRGVEHRAAHSEARICLRSERKSMAAGRKEDMKAIWESISTWVVISKEGYLDFEKLRNQSGWEGPENSRRGQRPGLEAVIKMGEEEWKGLCFRYG